MKIKHLSGGVVQVCIQIKMECPVCYESRSECKFVCGHSFCYQCVKTWYQKGSQTCPMCRTTMCFKGVRCAKREWEREKREGILASVLEELLDDPEDFEYGVDIMGFMYERYNTLMENYPGIDGDTLDYVLRNPWVDIEVDRVLEYHEVPTYMRYLMVSKTSWGVKRASCHLIFFVSLL